MANEFKVKNGLIVIGDLTTSGTITINGALAATQSWVTSQAYLTSASLSGYATQSYVTSAIASLVDSAPAALDTLKELATALGNDASFATTVTNSIASKLSLSGGTMTGQILFQTSALNNGFRWDVNSDAAGITFKNTGDGDNNSYFNFFTEDNGNEYFKFSHNTWNIGSFDFMDVKNGVIRTNGDIYVNASQSGTRSAGTNELINGSRVWHAGDFSSTNISNWNTAYSWGNHASVGYLTTYTDTLATVTGRGATTSTNISVNTINIGTDATYGAAYRSVSFGYNGDGSNRILAANNTSDGMYFMAATGQGFNFRPNGGTANLVVINSTGNVGIGTTSPSQKLDVSGNIQGTTGLTLTGNAAKVSTTYAGVTTTNFFTDAGGGVISVDGSNKISLRQGGVSGTDAITIAGTGNVGIGTTSPGYKLDVATGNDNAIRILNSLGSNNNGLALAVGSGTPWMDFNGSSFSIKYNPNPGSWNGGANNHFTILSGGNVGIGTTSPAFKTTISADITKSNDINPGTAQLSLEGATTPGKRMILGYDTNSNGFGFIKAGNYGVTWTSLSLQPDGGNVGIGTTSPSYKLDINGNSRTTGIHYVDTYLVTPLIYGGGPITMGNNVFINSTEDGKLTLRVPSGDSSEWNYINFTGSNGVRDAYLGTDGGGAPIWYRDDNGVNITLGSSVLINGNTAWHAGNDGSGSGLDADTVDGVQVDSIVYGNARGTNDSVTTNNNDLDKTGYYTSDSFATKPSGVANWMYIEHIKLYNANTAYQKQLGYDTYDDRMWVRTKSGGAWSSWKQIWTSDSLTNLSQLTNGPGYITSSALSGYATTSYVTTQINNLINGAPGALDTLDELAAALGDDANFATTVTNSIAGKVSKSGDTITSGNQQVLVLSHSANTADFNDALFLNNTTSNQQVQIGMAATGSDGNHHRVSLRAYKGTQPLEGVFGIALRQPGSAAHTQRLTLDYLGNLTIGGALTESSSLKLKENIETSEGNLEKVVNLRPVTYNKIGSQTTELGLIAEEVAEVYPEFVQYDENGEPVGVHYSRLTAALIGAVKELNEQLQELKRNK